MTANRVIDEHSELSGVGSLTHDQLDAYVNTSPYVIVSGAVGSVPPGARKLVAGPGYATLKKLHARLAEHEANQRAV
jgi:hypothetical protein